MARALLDLSFGKLFLNKANERLVSKETVVRGEVKHFGIKQVAKGHVSTVKSWRG